MDSETPLRQIRAAYDDETVTVYQAYAPGIADAALAAGTFVAPFKRERMTWIKPSFRWMMYRCGWANKPGQERVLAVTLTRTGFEWALRHACLSHFAPEVYSDHDEWQARLGRSPVRIQWDPERDLHHRPLPHRSVQIGLGGVAVEQYVDRWITGIRDITATAHRIGRCVADGELVTAAALLPAERPYPLPAEIGAVIGASAGL
ncbi:DUF4291 domain-containing protein [Nocardia arthritidis]|uniref:DUF4291 family protein n=1 Tax=Nocardia arthritidis TaxID=228602 RepID=A0A6G9YK04_9NOCA|nr:DUF4291 domain-containing protein [Nocardia arthritidis]QIS13518.1 DUF4291 family protein [Nocardia arthritidis]